MDIINEFIEALDEEIDAIKRGKGGSVVKIFNGRFLREVSGLFIYAFNLENFLAIFDDSPAEIDIQGRQYPVQVISTRGLEVEIGLENNFGQYIPEARLITNLWFLMELLKKKYLAHKEGEEKRDFTISLDLFSNSIDNRSIDEILECSNCGAKNRITKYDAHQTLICGKCEKRLSCRYSVSDDPPNDAQKRAINASFLSPLAVIWGPPGTGKTKIIAQAIEAHLNAGRRILLVSHANNAVDEALEKVATHLKPSPFYQEGRLVRLGIPRDEHLQKIEEEGLELVLLDRIAEKMGESLTQEMRKLEKDKVIIEQELSEIIETLDAVDRMNTISSEKIELKSSIQSVQKDLARSENELAQNENVQRRNRERLKQAEDAGALKKIFLGMNPEKIQQEIDKLSIVLDSQRRLVNEMHVRLHNLETSLTQKDAQYLDLKGSVEKTLATIGVTEGELREKKKVLTGKIDKILSRISEIEKQLSELQAQILSEAKLVATTLTKTFTAKQLTETPFDVLILDEASMAPLTHLFWAGSRCAKYVTIVGDFLQLPPICISDKALAQKWLGRSIFDILNIKGVRDACSDKRVTLLDTQYRMVPQISEFPNRVFYQDTLTDHPSTINQALDDGISQSALVLVDTTEMNPWCSRISTGGRFNLYNALVSAHIAKEIIESGTGIKIGLMTPYAAQARLANRILKDWDLLDRVRVSTVHSFQGGEEPVIIFDSVEGPGTKVAPMLDDTRLDSDARLLLNVAMTRAKNKIYFIGHIDHLQYQLHEDSCLARMIDHFYDNAEIMSSDQFVDDFSTTDFEKWANLLLPPISQETYEGNFHTEKNFWPRFIADLKTVKDRLIIMSPFISIRRCDTLMNFFQVMRNNGIHIKIYTRPRSQQTGAMADQAAMVIEQFQKLSIKVLERRSMHQKVAIFDDNVAWEGSLNILSHKDTQEHMRRFCEKSAIEEIIRNLELENDESTGTQTEEKCPGSKRMPDCNGYLVIRTQRKTRRKFLGCSNFPKCDYTQPLSGKRKTSRKKRYKND